MKHFQDGYRWLTEFEHGHLKDNKIKSRSQDVILPECITFNSLVFALNCVEWTVMWGLNEEKIEKPKAMKDDMKDNNDSDE